MVPSDSVLGIKLLGYQNEPTVSVYSFIHTSGMTHLTGQPDWI